jgi:membrane fusion protein (multidrug efflux system)
MTPEVGVSEVRAAEVPITFTFAGKVDAYRDVEVRPQVGGTLLSREFNEGANVEDGQLLFRIDPRPYEVALARANAQLAQAQATLRQAEENLARIEELFRRQVATEKQFDDARAARDQAKASVQLAQAEVDAAKLNLGFTEVHAPISGATSVRSPPIGTLVLAQQTVLTTITQLDPAYVSYSFTESELKEFRAINARRGKPITEADLTIELRFGDGSPYPIQGRVYTAARTVDPQTGTIQARAIFPNSDGVLLPGLFVRIIVHGVTLPDAIVIPEQAVLQGPQGPFVYVVDANSTAQPRPVRVGRELEGGRNIEEGLQPGEHVIVDGIIRVRPGAPVRVAAPAGQPQAFEMKP